MQKDGDQFLRFCAHQFKPNFTRQKLVLDVGSAEIFGNNRSLFDSTCEQHGNDVVMGKNVDLAYRTHELPFAGPMFDTIVSSTCFQNDPEQVASLKKIVEILRPGGIFAFTCASTDHPEFGTRANKPDWCLATKVNLRNWRDYYKNLTFDDILGAIPVEEVFSQQAAQQNQSTHELQFYGVKRDPRRPTLEQSVPEYSGNRIVKVAPLPPPVLEIPEVTAVDISGAPVDVSEATVDISGVPIDVSGVPLDVSGAPVDVSEAPLDISGAPVDISGAPVDVSGAPLDVSGVPIDNTQTTIVEESTITTSPETPTSSETSHNVVAPISATPTSDTPSLPESSIHVPVTQSELTPEEQALVAPQIQNMNN